MAKKIKTKIAAPIKSSRGIEAKYRRQMNKLGKLLIASVKIEVLEYIKAHESTYVMDGVGDQLEVIFNRLNARFTGTAVAGFAKVTSQQMVNRVGQSNKAKFDRTVARATGVDLGSIIATEGLEDFVALSVNKNASLIRSLPEEYLKQVETIVNNGVVSGARYSTIQKEIMAKTGANSKLANRIKTIARNEVQTVNSQISLRRSDNLGIKKGIFRTSKDERVRKCHKELNGDEYELKKGAWSESCGKYIQPGITDINCRCSYSPIINIDETGSITEKEPEKLVEKKVIKKVAEIPRTKTWQPKMTKSEAKKWAKGSKWDFEIFHGTETMSAEESIERSGFDFSKTSMFGKGIYFGKNKSDVSQWGKRILTSRPNVKKVLEVDFTDITPKGIAKIKKWSELQASGGGGDAGRKAFLKEGIEGYSLKMPTGETHYIILDPKFITTVE